MLSNRAFGSSAEDPSFQMLSFRQPIVCGSNLMNQQILAQQLSNESLQDKEFLQKRLFEARNTYFSVA